MPNLQYILIKNEKIPVRIRNYKNSKSVKIFFRGNVLNITKPTRFSNKNLIKILKENEESIYNKYKKIKLSEICTIKQWKTGEKIYYKGTEFSIIRKLEEIQNIKIQINERDKEFILIVPYNMENEEIKNKVDYIVKKLLKNNIEYVLSSKVPYWSKIMKIEYNTFKVRDTISKYGSCMPSKKNLYFSSRLIMLPDKVIDAIVVHEFAHMKYKYHNEEFYKFVSIYIPNYKEIDKWLKNNGKIIMF